MKKLVEVLRSILALMAAKQSSSSCLKFICAMQMFPCKSFVCLFTLPPTKEHQGRSVGWTPN